MLRRVRPAGEDRVSALPDELISLIVGRLDTRTALSTAVLARRWAHIPRDLPGLDFRVSDVLPPEYDRTLTLRRSNMPRDTVLAETLDHLMARCEIDTITAFAAGVVGFLEADGGLARRRFKTLRLEFFQAPDAGCVVDRLIAAAVGAWGVEDLEVLVRQPSCDDLQAPPYRFPHDLNCLKDGLRSLTLGGNCCMLPPLLHSYGALTTLVLRDMAASTPVDAYQRVFFECTRLQVLRLVSCGCAHDRLVVDAPCSEMRELTLDRCKFMAIELRNLPMLVRLACCLTDTNTLVFGSVPSLMHTNLTFAAETLVEKHCLDGICNFLKGISPTTMTKLVLRFTGLRRWMLPIPPDKTLLHLKKLLVADLPANWNITWPCWLLLAAPSLEVLHIQVPCSEEEPCYGWELQMSSPETLQRHHCLKELVIIGFLQRHKWFLKYVVSVCTSLQRVILLKDAHVQYDGLWDWDIITGQQASPWSNDDEMVVRTITKSGCRPFVELSLG